ncbi:MAG: RNA polymerase sigma factor SigM [Alphaproteobacteria bacterium ADurb.Bin438]|nr:MAG: RNA polymerase sigma factor SigM [Alphaproteobacteria bacterium ADurb.Bin438]
MKQKNDKELIEDIKQSNDIKSFEILLERYNKSGINFVYKLLNDISNAEDIVQDTFIKFYENVKDFNLKGESFKPWFFTVLHNKAMDFLKKHNRFDNLDDFEIKEDTESSFEKIETQELKTIITKALDGLPIRQKEALILNYYEEIPQIEASTIMNVSIKAYESLLSRAKQNIKTKLKGVIDYEF